jgi:hypothetical protein
MWLKLNIAQRTTLGFIMIICIMGVAVWSANDALIVSQQALSKATWVESTKIRDVRVWCKT